MKFKKGDLVFYLPWSEPQAFAGGDTVMYVIGFDEERQRYKCFDLGIYTDNIQSIYLCKEEDLDFVPVDSKFRNNKRYWNRAEQEWFDELCYPVYECTGYNQVKDIREAAHTLPSIQEWVKFQGPQSSKAKRKKFKKGEMVFYISHSNNESSYKKILYVIGFDKNANKYKFFEPEAFLGEARICYCLDNEIEAVPEDSNLKKNTILANLSKKKWFDELCYPLYYYHDDKEVLLRESWFTYDEIAILRKEKKQQEQFK